MVFSLTNIRSYILFVRYIQNLSLLSQCLITFDQINKYSSLRRTFIGVKSQTVNQDSDTLRICKAMRLSVGRSTRKNSIGHPKFPLEFYFRKHKTTRSLQDTHPRNLIFQVLTHFKIWKSKLNFLSCNSYKNYTGSSHWNVSYADNLFTDLLMEFEE